MLPSNLLHITRNSYGSSFQTLIVCTAVFVGVVGRQQHDPQYHVAASGDRNCKCLTCHSARLWRVWGALQKPPVPLQGSPNIRMSEESNHNLLTSWGFLHYLRPFPAPSWQWGRGFQGGALQHPSLKTSGIWVLKTYTLPHSGYTLTGYSTMDIPKQVFTNTQLHQQPPCPQAAYHLV